MRMHAFHAFHTAYVEPECRMAQPACPQTPSGHCSTAPSRQAGRQGRPRARVQGCGAAAGEGVLLALALPAGGGPGAPACPGAQVLVLRLGAGEAGGLQACSPSAPLGLAAHNARGCAAEKGRALLMSRSQSAE